MAVWVANAALIPAGIESVPGPCASYAPGGERLLIKGMTVAAVLDKRSGSIRVIAGRTSTALSSSDR